MSEAALENTIESKVITNEFLEKALRSGKGRSDIVVKGFVLHPRQRELQNFTNASVSLKVNVVENGETRERDLFIKLIAKAAVVKKIILEDMKMFKKEQTAYSQIIPDMIKYQKESDIEPIRPSVPKYVYSVADDSNGIVVLEDVRPLGYIMADSRKGLDYEHCELVMKELAVFHALSFAIKHKDPKRIQEYPYLFHEAIATDTLTPYLKRGFEASVNLVKTSDDASTINPLPNASSRRHS